jgi:hypothetical protein
VIAVCCTVVVAAVSLFSLHPATYLTNNVGARAPVGRALFLAYEIGMWFYAWKELEGYSAAAISGAVLAAPAVALVLIPEVTDQSPNVFGIVFLSYLSLSHFLYAFSNWRKLMKAPLDL